MNNNFTTIKRIKFIQNYLTKNNLDGFIQPRADSYLGEYVPECDARLKWLSGFTGSAGIILILRNQVILFVDSRYTIQAKNETKNTGIKVILSSKQSLEQYIVSNAKKYNKIAYDPWLHSYSYIKGILNIGKKYNIQFLSLKENPIDLFWNKDRNKIPNSKINIHPIKYAGINSTSKIKKLCIYMKELNVNAYILNHPDAIAWLLNIRGMDLNHTPIILTRAIIFSNGNIFLFIDSSRIGKKIQRHLKNNTKIYPADSIIKEIIKISKNNNKILIDPSNVSYALVQNIKSKSTNLIEKKCPIEKMKSIKNKVEIKGAISAHIKDGEALSKFLYWIKKSKTSLNSELVASNKIDKLRSKQDNFICTSFETISGFASNGAIIHYRVTEKSNKQFTNNNLYLCDSGGQYLEGTTDVTRTVAIGKPTQNMKEHFSTVLKGHIALASAIFPYGTTGNDLDLLARLPLWKKDLNYGHGTGHGVGSCLSVHEGPHRISKGSFTILEPGMITSNEPGFYLTNKYGIRIENLMLVKKIKNKNNKNMLTFETLTLAPIDINLVNYDLLTKEEIFWLNNYHNKVYEKISNNLDRENRKWLKKVCTPFLKS